MGEPASGTGAAGSVAPTGGAGAASRRRWRWRGRPRWQLVTAAVVAGLLVLGVVAVIAYRVLAPAEVVTPAGYLPTPPAAEPGPVARLSAAPLLVDGRLRVYATTRQMRADGPIDMRTQATPAWSFRRWPQQLIGVAAAGTTVTSRWSDGEIVAIDARTGEVSWRVAGPVPGQSEYAGRRTGAQTVYAPSGLHTGTTADGRRLVVARGESQVLGVDLATGRELWRTELPGQGDACRAAGFTTTGGQLALVNGCAAPPTLELYDLSTGQLAQTWQPEGAGPGLAVEPLGCTVARSHCAGLRTTGAGESRGWLVDGPDPVPAPPLDPVDTMLVDGLAIGQDPGSGEVVANSARTGVPVWRTDAPARRAPDGDGARLIAVQPGQAHLLTGDRQLITLDSGSGAELSRFVLIMPSERITDWAPGYVYAQSGFVAIERLRLPVDPDADDGRYYRLQETVILANT
ncbi:PQQ-binding-like beta-propeller repeat protein [Solwaraspora sp. WMMB335]|uniref:outer membrane protein assembly factor BamB family protein n=1 Tax=Solwaraspora sp. WMMB335 TaxID=3404118 RepID=UPI003B940093